MHPRTVELMRDQANAIRRALGGSAAPEKESAATKADEETEEVSIEEVARRFALLEAMARRVPAVVERVPPFSFAPPIDALDDENELLIEVAVPGLDKGDVSVERTEELLVVSGIRAGEKAANGRTYLHAEIPRGPFHRVIRLPYPIESDPKFEISRGLIRIRLAKSGQGTTQKS